MCEIILSYYMTGGLSAQRIHTNGRKPPDCGSAANPGRGRPNKGEKKCTAEKCLFFDLKMSGIVLIIVFKDA
jgi:hypothetical protein